MQIQRAFQNKDLVQQIQKRLATLAQERDAYTFMEVCGTHTHAIGRWGLLSLLPSNLRLVSGPGCPVCVTPAGYIDNACQLALEKGVVIATFGDLLRVPGLRTSLEAAKAQGARIEVLYSAHAALGLAQSTQAEVVFLAIGFETTAAGIAAAVAAADKGGIKNLSFYTAIKCVPPVLVALMQDPELHIDGFLLPGHVSVILGLAPYAVLADHSRVGVIAGFEPVDIMQGMEALVLAVNQGAWGVKNLYPRAVRPGGNPKAQVQMDQVFVESDAVLRGLGVIPGAGCELDEAYVHLDAAQRFGLPVLADAPTPGCACGDVLKGKITPPDCPLFGKRCTPTDPVGPCMVSSEGSCSAWYKYNL